MSPKQQAHRPTKRAPTPRSGSTAAKGGSASTAAGGPSAGGGWSQLLADAQREVLAVTFLVPEGLPAGATSATVRMRGRWHGESRPEGRDAFKVEERIEGLPPGAGDFTITKVISGVAPGDWTVTGELVVDRPRSGRGPGRGVPDRPMPLELADWSWRRWKPVPVTGDQRTALPVLARRPAVLAGAWPAMVVLGIIVALVVQALLAGRDGGLAQGRVLAASAIAVVLGGIGAKVWYLAQRRPGASWNGWCIQGFVLAVVVVGVAVVPALGLSLGGYLDVTTPAMFLGMAIGRIGCQFAGCCYGRPTSSRLGLWSSDRRLGIRRVPAQLLESGLAFLVAAGSLIVVLADADRPDGPLFAAALGIYTLGRQRLLRVRGEPRRTTTGTTLTSVAAAAASVAAVAVLIAG